MTIVTGVSLPADGRRRMKTGLTASLRKLELGECFVYPTPAGVSVTNRRVTAINYAKRVGIRVTTRIDGRDVYVSRVA